MWVSVVSEPLFTQQSKQNVAELSLKTDEFELVFGLLAQTDLRKF